MTASQITLLTLPYDVRFLIYQHLFPPSEDHIYLQAMAGDIRAITPHVPFSFLLTCRRLHAEASGFLYNSYLFNIVGPKEDCLETHERFLRVLEKYARDEVHVDVFSNGDHSATMALSLHTGRGKVATVEDRGRGIRTTIQDLREELRRGSLSYSGRRYFLVAHLRMLRQFLAGRIVTVYLGIAMLVAWVAWMLGNRHAPNNSQAT